MNDENSRLPLPDLIRGITLISMILYHALWDLIFFFGMKIPWYEKAPGYIWQQSICWSFIFLSGFVLPMGRFAIKRGMLIFLCGGIVSLATLFFVPDDPVVFGVLTFLGSAMILTGIIEPALKKLHPLFALVLNFLLFLATKKITGGVINLGVSLIRLPKSLYKNLFTTFLGFPFAGFISSDFFPLLPWIFLYWTGFFFYLFLKQKKALSFLRFGNVPWLLWIGRHSLLIYMLHQPVLYLVFCLCFAVLK